MNSYGEQDWARGYGNGLGFLPAAAAPALAAAGPVGWVALGISTAASILARLFAGGKDDQATNYRPPSDAAQQFVEFNDQRGSERVAYDLSQSSLAEAQRRGNRWEDIYSYYSAFTSNSTGAASPAARRVIEDAARNNGVSIARAADMILTVAGVTRIVQSFLPSGRGATGAGSGLPPYCPAGTYHPYPIGHPDQDLCVPFPEWATGSGNSGNAQSRGAQSGASRSARTATQRRQQPGVPAGFRINPQTGQLEPDPDMQAGGTGANGGGFPWWILLVAAGVLVVSDSGSSGGRRRR